MNAPEMVARTGRLAGRLMDSRDRVGLFASFPFGSGGFAGKKGGGRGKREGKQFPIFLRRLFSVIQLGREEEETAEGREERRFWKKKWGKLITLSVPLFPPYSAFSRTERGKRKRKRPSKGMIYHGPTAGRTTRT